MSSEKTEHYQLHKWIPEDDFVRTEFNENFTKLDTVLAGKSEVVFGSYTGTDTANRVISLGFTPKCVILVTDSGALGYANTPYDVGGGVFFSETNISNFKMVSGGFQVSNVGDHGGSTNNGRAHYYIAYR